MMRTTVLTDTLTAAERVFKAMVANAMAKDESKPEEEHLVRKIFVDTDLDFLLELAIKDSGFDEHCKDTILDQFWQDEWRKMGLNPAEFSGTNKDPFHENMPIVTISCLDLLKGDYIYQQYRNLMDVEEMSQETYNKAKRYLEKAAGYGCYFALNALCTNGLAQMKNAASSERVAMTDKILKYAQKAADLHLTPGFLLLSNVQQELYLYKMDLFPDAEKELLKKVFFMNVAVTLHMAQKLEPYSEAMINNAYQGKTVWQASCGTLSSWFQAKVRLQNMSGSILTTADMNDASKQANIMFNNLISARNLVLPDTRTKMVEDINVSSAASASASASVYDDDAKSEKKMRM